MKQLEKMLDKQRRMSRAASRATIDDPSPAQLALQRQSSSAVKTVTSAGEEEGGIELHEKGAHELEAAHPHTEHEEDKPVLTPREIRWMVW